MSFDLGGRRVEEEGQAQAAGAIASANDISIAFDDDHRQLATLLRHAGCGYSSNQLATSMLMIGRSLAGAFALESGVLARIGLPSSAVEVLSSLRSFLLASLRREINIGPVVSGSAQLLDYLHLAMGQLSVEEFRVLFLDKDRRIILDEAMARGASDRCTIYVRQVVIRALDLAASGLILVHNHPSGALDPSSDDIVLTQMIVDAARALDIKVHEHLIISRAGHTSLRQLGYL